MTLRDRISGTVAECPPGLVLIGQWTLHVGDSNYAPLFNGCSAEDGDVLVPDPLGRWHIGGVDSRATAGGRFFAEGLLAAQDAEAFIQLGSSLREPAKANGGWLEWAMTSPLAPGLDEAVKEHPLEGKIEDELHHLEEVCMKPRTHIRLETERVLISRARRIDARAPMWLAGHTEDWEHRTITGIRPARILAHVREEDWNLYENRVAARLVDNLATWLLRRIAEVRRVLVDVFVRLADYRVSTDGSRHRLRRIFDLWGEAWGDSQGRDAAEHTLKRLERLLYRILRLMDSPLYVGVPRAAQVPRTLRTTNLLGNDAHYRGVARLWHHWSDLAAPTALSPAQLYRRYQSIHRGFDAWCMLVVVRACSQLGLFPIDEDLEMAIKPGCFVRLTSGHQVDWLGDGTVRVADGSAPVVRFVPLMHVIERAHERDTVEARVSSILNAAADNAVWTVILHPAIPGPSKLPGLAGVGDPPFPHVRGAVDFVRVSPFSLESVERVARAIRWATIVPRMLAYPPAITAPPPLLEHRVDAWQKKGDPNSWRLVRPLRSEEQAGLALERKLAEARHNRDSLATERRQADEQLRRARGDRREMSDLNRRKRELLEPLHEAEELVRRLEEFNDALARAERELVPLAVCPVCRAPAEFAPRADSCFAARCSSDGCGATWELRNEPESGVRVPVLLPGGVKPAAWPREGAPQWVDDVLGCDVLAVPFIGTDGAVVFRRPRSISTTSGSSG